MIKPHWKPIKKPLFSILSKEFTENPKNRVCVKIKIYIFMKTLELNQMENTKGGVTVEEYCRTLNLIIDNNPVTESMLFFSEAYGCDYFRNH